MNSARRTWDIAKANWYGSTNRTDMIRKEKNPRGERDFEVLVQIVEAEGKAGRDGCARERGGRVCLGSMGK